MILSLVKVKADCLNSQYSYFEQLVVVALTNCIDYNFYIKDAISKCCEIVVQKNYNSKIPLDLH